jgi:predicted MFS family arabinose efflux permease
VRAQSLRAVTLPAVLGGARIAPTTVFASLFLLTVSCRTVLIAVIPLQALALLGSAQAVSVMFLLVSTCSIATALLLPALILRIRTRRAFHLAAAIGILGALLLAVPVLPVFALGMVCWAVSTATFEVTMNLYIMHLILRRDIARFEPKRVLFMVTAYTVGPALGVWLQAWAGHFAPFALAILSSALAVAWFRRLGLREAGARQYLRNAPNPLVHVRRYFAQPRLRLAWFIALARSSWWSTFMFYTPIYAVTVGLGEAGGGALVSAGMATVYSVGLWGRYRARTSTRALLMLGFALSGASSIVVTVFADSPLAGAALLLLATLCTASLDGAGNTPFLRAVRPLEREEMTGVFSIYRDVSQLLPPALFAVILGVLPVHAVFAVAGVWMLVMAWFSRHLPRRL